MSKFKFEMAVVVAATSVEDALNQVGRHIGTINRQMASGVEGLAPEFDLLQVDDSIDATDLTDKVTQSRGPIKLELDPESEAGKAYAIQEAARALEAEAEAKRLANAGKSDAEVLAEHSAAEQATLNQEPVPAT